MSWVLFVSGNIWMVLIVLLFALVSKLRPNLQYSAGFTLTVIIVSVSPIVLALLVPHYLISDNMITQSLSASVSGVRETVILPSALQPVAMLPFILLLYGGITFVLIARLCIRLIKIRRYSVAATQCVNGHRVDIIDAPLPPCSIGWPQARVIIPNSLAESLSAPDLNRIIRHETSHLRHRDPDVTVGLLILSAILWFNPFLGWIISRWRFAAELRADAYAIGSTDKFERAAYGQLLLSLSRQKNGRALPCPSANLSHPARSIKMRLNHILTVKSPDRKRRVLLGLTLAACLSAGGGTFIVAGATPTSQKADDVKPLMRVPPYMPAYCEGFDPSQVEIDVTQNDQRFYATAEVGRVALEYDVTSEGRVENIRITKSNYPCFEAPSLTSLQKWTYPESSNGYQNLQTLLTYRINAIDGDFQSNLEKFATPN